MKEEGEKENAQPVVEGGCGTLVETARQEEERREEQRGDAGPAPGAAIDTPAHGQACAARESDLHEIFHLLKMTERGPSGSAGQRAGAGANTYEKVQASLTKRVDIAKVTCLPASEIGGR